MLWYLRKNSFRNKAPFPVAVNTVQVNAGYTGTLHVRHIQSATHFVADAVICGHYYKSGSLTRPSCGRGSIRQVLFPSLPGQAGGHICNLFHQASPGFVLQENLHPSDSAISIVPRQKGMPYRKIVDKKESFHGRYYVFMLLFDTILTKIKQFQNSIFIYSCIFARVKQK